MLALAACTPRVAPEDLPPLPSLDVSGAQDAVSRQKTEAYAGVERDPMDAQANGHLGMVYRTYREFEFAEILLGRARLLAPRNADWRYYHGEVLEQLGEVEPATAAMRAVLDLEPADIPARLRLGELLLQAGQVEASRELLQQLAAEQPDYGRAFTALGAALEAGDKLEDAAAAWHRALERAGDFGQGHYALAQIYRRLGRPAEAERHLARFTTLGDTRAPLYDPRLERLFKLNVSDRPLIRAAQAAKARGDSGAALDLLEQAIARNPSNMETRAALITGYTASGDFDRAGEHQRAGEAVDADHAEFNYALGRLRQQQGNYRDAREILTAVTAQAPGHARARAWLGRVQELEGDTVAAGHSYALAVKTEPKNPTARQFYTAWLLQFATPDEAIAALDNMAGTDATDLAMIHAAIAEVHHRRGDRKAALQALDRGLLEARRFEQKQMTGKLLKMRAALNRGPLQQ